MTGPHFNHPNICSRINIAWFLEELLISKEITNAIKRNCLKELCDYNEMKQSHIFFKPVYNNAIVSNNILITNFKNYAFQRYICWHLLSFRTVWRKSILVEVLCNFTPREF